MPIIISKGGKNAKKIEKSSFEKEDYLQRYIYDNPETIPLYDIKEDIRLLILARPFTKRKSKEWDEQKFVEDMRAKVQDRAIADMILDLLKFARESADLREFGSGAESGSFTFKILTKEGEKKISVFTIYSNGTLNLRFRNMAQRTSKEIAELFYDSLQTLPAAKNWNKEEIMGRSLKLRTPFNEVLPKQNVVELFKSAVLDLKRILKE